MLPILFNILKRYVPYITLPVAGVIGGIGYYIEGCISDRYTPPTEPIVQQREERLLKNVDFGVQPVNKKHKPLEVNLSPSLSS